ncbi:MAG: ATP-binding protein [Candidatus Aceula lacicola]|nr:ATP-binding protein [Candidatus Aceula lacicola]
MKIQVKLVLFLLLTIVFFSVGLFFIDQIQQKEFFTILEDRKEHTTYFFNEIFNLKGNSLDAISFDYTYWDEMVDLIERKNQTDEEAEEWAEENIGNAMETYDIQFAWVYDLDSRLIYSIQEEEEGFLKEFPISFNKIKEKLYSEHFVDFFVWSKEGPLEVRGATIHPTSDVDRKTPPRGYFLVARALNNEFVENFSQLMEGNVFLMDRLSYKDEDVKELHRDLEDVFYIYRELYGFDGEAVGSLVFRTQYPLADYLLRSKQKNFYYFIVSIISFLIFFFLFGFVWISKPLGKISKALSCEEVDQLEDLEKSGAEFGVIARLISKFFKQQKQLKEAQGQILQSEKMAAVGQLSAGVAHEVKNPLAIILLSVGSLDHEIAESDEKTRSHLKMIKEAAERANSVVVQLLNFSRSSDIKMEEVSVEEILNNATLLAKNVFKSKNIIFHWECFIQEIIIFADKILMEQVFFNLLLNAGDAIEGAGDIFVKTCLEKDKTQKDQIVVEVSDTGPGMSKEVMSRIFEPFYTTKEQGRGTGLGLSTVYMILEKHHATIEVESEEGKGTKFIIRIPFSAK